MPLSIMATHERVTCDGCSARYFSSLRYKCLVCSDYDLCAACYDSGIATGQHSIEHAMQCIPTRNQCSVYFGGEISAPGGLVQSESYVCPHCGALGLTQPHLEDHLRAFHADATAVRVVCPICSSQRGVDYNRHVVDLPKHIAEVHQPNSEFYGNVSQAYQRRLVQHQAAAGSAYYFGGRPPRAPTTQVIEPSSAGSTPLTPAPTRGDPLDPDLEVLMQLSGLRSRAAAAHELTMTSHLRELEMQLAATKQQLERLPLRQTEPARTSIAVQQHGSARMYVDARGSAPISVAAAAPDSSAAAGSAAAAGAMRAAMSSSGSRAQFVLARMHAQVSVDEAQLASTETARANRSAFLQELLLSGLTIPPDTPGPSPPTQSSASFTSSTSVLLPNATEARDGIVSESHDSRNLLTNGDEGNESSHEIAVMAAASQTRFRAEQKQGALKAPTDIKVAGVKSVRM